MQLPIELGTINSSYIHCGQCVAICPESTVFPDKGSINKLQTSTISSTEFQYLSSTIRTCRSFQDKAVNKEILDSLIDNMKHYPSASNSRPIEITIVNTKELIQKLNNHTAHKLIRTLQLMTSPILRFIFRIVAPKFEMSGLIQYKKHFM